MKCLACKKEIPADDLVVMRDLTALCLRCANELREAFTYYIGGNKVTKGEFDKEVKKAE